MKDLDWKKRRARLFSDSMFSSSPMIESSVRRSMRESSFPLEEDWDLRLVWYL